jgi:hypothetical protein
MDNGKYLLIIIECRQTSISRQPKYLHIVLGDISGQKILFDPFSSNRSTLLSLKKILIESEKSQRKVREKYLPNDCKK